MFSSFRSSLNSRDKSIKTEREHADQIQYYSERAGIYVYGKKYSSDPTTGFCEFSNMWGFVEASIASGSSLMVLCPNSFTNVALRSVAAAPVSSSVFDDDADTFLVPVQEIKAVAPGAETFFHESFHLVLGDKMTPKGGEEYNALRMMGKKTRANGKKYKKSSALENPQSYTYAAYVTLFSLSSKIKGIINMKTQDCI
jgi:hypothetical protein